MHHLVVFTVFLLAMHESKQTHIIGCAISWCANYSNWLIRVLTTDSFHQMIHNLSNDHSLALWLFLYFNNKQPDPKTRTPKFRIQIEHDVHKITSQNSSSSKYHNSYVPL